MNGVLLSAGKQSVLPKVSILMLACNHSRYIAEAIQSVVDQQAEFSFELLIGEDASTDGTAAIAECFQKQFPWITVVRSARNHGMYHNLAQIFYRARGEYIAFLEGDDFWISRDKLQKQISYLEAHPETVLCFHKARLFKDGEFTGAEFPETTRSVFGLEDFLRENWVPTCSAVFRRSALREIPGWCADLDLLDWPIFLLLAERGEVRSLSDIASAYRIHGKGAWSPLRPEEKSERMIKVLLAVKKHFGRRFAKLIDARVSDLYEHIAWCCEDRKALDAALSATWKATVAAPSIRAHSLGSCLRLALRSTFSQ